MELLILLVTSTFFIFWNILAVLGLVFLVVKFIQFLNGKPMKKKAVPTESPMKVETPQKPKIDPRNIFLNTGIVLLWFSSLFLGFANSFIADQTRTKWYLLLLLLLHYGAIYLFSTDKRYSSTKKLTLNLTFISVIFFGMRYWFGNLQFDTVLRSVDFFFIFGIFVSAISSLYYRETKKGTYLFFFTSSIIATIFFASFSLIGNKIYQLPFILALTLITFIPIRHFIKKEKTYNKAFLPIYRLAFLILGLIHTASILINQLSIDTYNETLINAVALFIPLLFTIIVRIFDKRGITLIIEGLLFPYRAVLVGVLFVLSASTYLAWFTCIVIFVIGFIISFTKLYERASIRRFVFPMMLSGLVLSYSYSIRKPFYIENFDTFAIGFTILIAQITLALKASHYRMKRLRIIDPFLQMFAIGAILYSLDLNFSTYVFNQNVFALVLIIPATISLIEVLLASKIQNARYLAFNTLFVLCIAVVLSITSPVINLFITIYSLITFLVISGVYKTALFGFPIAALAAISVTTTSVLMNLGGIEILILSGVLLVLMGNIWRVLKIVKCKNDFWLEFVHHIRRTAIIAGTFLLLYSFLTIHYTDHTILLLYAVLSILFLTAPTKSSKLKLVSGIGLVLTFWHLINISDTPKNANAQLYAFPVVILTLIASNKIEKKNKIVSGTGLLVALSLPMNIALLQSIFDPAPYNLIQGILVLVISMILFFYGKKKTIKLLKYTSFVYFIIELLILWARYFTYIPWWLYPSLLGVIFVVLSIIITLGISDNFSEK